MSQWRLIRLNTRSGTNLIYKFGFFLNSFYWFLPRDALLSVQSTVLRLHVVRPSVTLVDQDHIGWKSWKLIARTICLTHSLFVAQRPSTYSQGNMAKFKTWHIKLWGRVEVGWEKMAFWSTKVAISLKREKIEKKLLWGAYRNSPSLFRTVPSTTLYGLPFPKIGGLHGCTPPKTPSAIISRTGNATNFKFGQNSNRVHPNTSPLKILEKRKRGRIQWLPNFLRVPPIISGTGKATHFKFGQYIQRVDRYRYRRTSKNR